MFLIPFAVPCVYALKVCKSMYTQLPIEKDFEKELSILSNPVTLTKASASHSEKVKVKRLTLEPYQQRFLGENKKNVEIHVIQSGDAFMSRGMNFLNNKYAVLVIPEKYEEQLYKFFVNRQIYHIKYNEAAGLNISAASMSFCAAMVCSTFSMHFAVVTLVSATIGQIFKLAMRAVNQEEAERFAIKESSDEELQSVKTHLIGLKDRLKSEKKTKKWICVSFGCIKRKLQIVLHSFWIYEINDQLKRRAYAEQDWQRYKADPVAYKKLEEHSEMCVIS